MLRQRRSPEVGHGDGIAGMLIPADKTVYGEIFA